MGHHNTQEVSHLPGLPIAGQLLLKKTREPANIIFEAAHVIFLETFIPLEEKKHLCDFCRIKALIGLLFCDSAMGSISISFREMKLIRKGQRDSQIR